MFAWFMTDVIGFVLGLSVWFWLMARKNVEADTGSSQTSH